ncbi:beta-lactamase family protein [Parabacteroides sp. OttesenSCG-928-N08]|nr:beta-lactamase family protein [Parabacteroides sp. OttesenSCG-928-N08]
MRKNHRNRLIILLLLCVAGFVSCHRSQPVKHPYADGLPRSAPELQGVNSEGIIDFIEAIEESGIELHSLMIMRHGKVITEGWWYPFRSSFNHLVHSVSKSFTSTAIGFAVQEGLLHVDDKVISFFPNDLPESVSPELSRLTIQHLLTMSVGHEKEPAINGNQENWAKCFLATPIVNEPGEKFLYNSYATYMLSAILQKVTGENLLDFLTPRLFEPLGIKDIQWEKNWEGINTGGWGLRVKTVDMTKLGLLYLQKGIWEGQQLLSAEWIEEASSIHVYQQPYLTEEQNRYNEWGQGYGYQLWRCTHNCYRFDGAFGQFIFILPEQDAVITMTARSPNMYKQMELVWKHLLSAMTDSPIPTNEMLSEVLNSKLASLRLPDPFRTDEELSLPKSENRIYTMQPNGLGIDQMKFAFDDKSNCTFTLTKGEKSYELAFGQDAWMHGTTDKPSPYFSSDRRNPEGLFPLGYAGYNSFTEKDLFSLRLVYTTDFQNETYLCRFSEGTVEVKISNSMEENKPPVVLTGRQQ